MPPSELPLRNFLNAAKNRVSEGFRKQREEKTPWAGVCTPYISTAEFSRWNSPVFKSKQLATWLTAWVYRMPSNHDVGGSNPSGRMFYPIE